jgi:molybdenum cofactor guanylyltransferase
MGADKATLLVEGRPMVVRVAEALAEACALIRGPRGRSQEEGAYVTILGQEPMEGFAFLADIRPHEGPRSAIRAFEPRDAFVFVASCDLPLFRKEVPLRFSSLIGDFEAVIPNIGGRLQPTCALYTAGAIAKAKKNPEERSLLSWIDRLRCLVLNEAELGLPAQWVQGANTREELEGLLRSEIMSN